jgi:hypothetical protein
MLTSVSRSIHLKEPVGGRISVEFPDLPISAAVHVSHSADSPRGVLLSITPLLAVSAIAVVGPTAGTSWCFGSLMSTPDYEPQCQQEFTN